MLVVYLRFLSIQIVVLFRKSCIYTEKVVFFTKNLYFSRKFEKISKKWHISMLVNKSQRLVNFNRFYHLVKLYCHEKVETIIKSLIQIKKLTQTNTWQTLTCSLNPNTSVVFWFLCFIQFVMSSWMILIFWFIVFKKVTKKLKESQFLLSSLDLSLSIHFHSF